MVHLEDLNFSRKPSTARLSNRMNSIIWTIENCLNQRALYPALILLFSSIDILATLQTTDGYSTGASFKTWVDVYLLNQDQFPFDSEDLWSARCGIVHALRYESKNRNPKTIKYAFRDYDDDIKKISNPNQCVGVYIEDLFKAFKSGYSQYLAVLEKSTNQDVNRNLENLPPFIDLIPFDL